VRPTCVVGFLLLVFPGLAHSQTAAGAGQSAAAQQSSAPVLPSPAAPAASAGANATAADATCLRVYRQRRYAGSALAPSIYVDDQQIARVGNGRRVSIRLTPGPHTIRSDDKSSAISLDVKQGQEYFIRVDEATGFWKGHGRLTLVLPEQGSAEYKLEKPIEEDRKIAKDMIVNESEAADPASKADPGSKD
jgi:hypothetical protein